MAAVTTIDAADLQRRLNDAAGPLLVEFVKPDCAYCDRMAPELEALAGQWGEHAAFTLLDLAASPELVTTYGLRATPTVLLFSSAGQELGRKAGFQRCQQLDAFMRYHLGGAS